jgi:deoxycytidine triphosphate deaminase
MLSNVDFQNAIDERRLKITPYDPKKIQPASYDLKVGRVIGNTLDVRQYRDKTGGEITVYTLGPGETAIILTIEKIYLAENIGGHVDLTNEFASRGIHLLNPGHIDPGWGMDTSEQTEGYQLTAIVRNISNQPVELVQGKEILTLTLSYLRTPTSIPYGKTHRPINELSREGQLGESVKEIERFVEEQHKLKERLEKLEGDLGSKVSWPDLLSNLSFIIAAVSIVISVTIGVVFMASQYSKIQVGTYDVSVPIFLLIVLPTALVIIAFIMTVSTRWIKGRTRR